MKIYSNPTNGELHITMGHAPLSEDAEYKIFSVVGQVVMEGTLKNNTINVSPLANGMYFLKIDGKIVRFVKQ